MQIGSGFNCRGEDCFSNARKIISSNVGEKPFTKTTCTETKDLGGVSSIYCGDAVQRKMQEREKG